MGKWSCGETFVAKLLFFFLSVRNWEKTAFKYILDLFFLCVNQKEEISQFSLFRRLKRQTKENCYPFSISVFKQSTGSRKLRWFFNFPFIQKAEIVVAIGHFPAQQHEYRLIQTDFAAVTPGHRLYYTPHSI